MSDRKLSDEDITALSDELERRMVQRFYTDLGRGVWSLAWKAIVLTLLAIAAYGMANGAKG